MKFFTGQGVYYPEDPAMMTDVTETPEELATRLNNNEANYFVRMCHASPMHQTVPQPGSRNRPMFERLMAFGFVTAKAGMYDVTSDGRRAYRELTGVRR